MNCFSREPIYWRPEDIEEGNECPVLLIDRFHDYFTAWNMREKGLLPYSGGWMEQPYHWMQAFELIGPQVIDVRRRLLKNLKPTDDTQWQ